MCPCNPNSISINIPDGPSGPVIPEFNAPISAPKIPFSNGSEYIFKPTTEAPDYTISTGLKKFPGNTVGTAYKIGDRVRVTAMDAPINYMEGEIKLIVPGEKGEIVVDIDYIFSGATGPIGATGPVFTSWYFEKKLISSSDFSSSIGDLPFLFDLVKITLPIGDLKSPLNPNYGKDIIDSIIKVLDQFLPFLMLYKFFLPILKIVLCIIEVVCALPNPAKIIRAVQRLFRECIPPFLALFPISALLVMILTILILIAQIISYIILLIFQLVNLLLQNIIYLADAIEKADEESILAIVSKIGLVLCLFQNLFVVLAMISLIIQIFKDILSLAFAIPPCDGSDNSSFQNCCTSDVCPNFIKYSNFIRTTGSFQYISQVEAYPDLIGLPDAIAKTLASALTTTKRGESFQFYDDASSHAPAGKYTIEGYNPGPGYQYQQFINMIDAKDIETSPKTIFFPIDGTYSASTPPSQAPYTVDMKIKYNPLQWGRTVKESGPERTLIFKDCIVTNPTQSVLIKPDNSIEIKTTGTLILAGGKGFEDDGSTVLVGYDRGAINNSTRLSDGSQATIENFFFIKNSPQKLTDPITSIIGKDIVTINDIEYTFKINNPVLLSKNLITYGCTPEVSIDRTFTNAVFSNELNVKISQLKNFKFPDITKAQECVLSAIDAFRNNVTKEGAETLQATAVACMQQLQQETEDGISSIIPIGFDQYKSIFEIDPSIQFTSKKIKVLVDLKESSGASLAQNLPEGSGKKIAAQITPSITLGDITPFVYDGSKYFTAEISSKIAGKGELEISFDNKKISNIDVPADLNSLSSISTRKIEYQFIYAPTGFPSVAVGVGDASDGQSPRREFGDISREESGREGSD